ncbi:ABC transporter permease [Paenibacillus flagellatus]|uniref:ABC transporter permease n=1 Tax=Paenibacillus flagellatus TaxID=2211139 RepID=A0A2V5K855_9BACL|nr:ABC transporter permease [Paenibacillus flagellatus]PYI55022.1 ABC transporter permease [Paenibacillus flagellatus]
MNRSLRHPTQWLPALASGLRRVVRPGGAERNGTAPSKVAVPNPFWVIVHKEIGDHVRSWRYSLLLGLMALTCIASVYTASLGMKDAISTEEEVRSFFFLKLYTASSSGIPPFMTFVSFLGPLIGIGLGFDAVNAERNKGTLSRMLAQPIHRDDLINAKFAASFIVVAVLFFALGFLVAGFGIVVLGVPPTPEEFWRMVGFLLLSTVYVGFWLNLSILFSVRFRQAATSALSAISVWIFFLVFYGMIIDLVANALLSDSADPESLMRDQGLLLLLSRLSPSQLFGEATTTLLVPSVRSLGPLTMEQIVGAIPSPLPLGQSLLLVWPQLTGLIAATVVTFAISYALFMRQEIRSR